MSQSQLKKITHEIRFSNNTLFITEELWGYSIKDQNGDNYACSELCKALIDAYLTRCYKIYDLQDQLKIIADENERYTEILEDNHLL